MKRISVFASGSGSNTQRLAEYFQEHEFINIDSIFTNNKEAFVLERAKNLQIPSFIFNREDLYHTSQIVNILLERKIDFIVLAGFLLLMPENIIRTFPKKIINIHPALLPKYGGKGMYGHHVHELVIQNKEKESGITIHYVNEKYDDGNIIFQAKCSIDLADDADSLAEKIHVLEYTHFPLIVEKLVLNV